MVNVNRLKAKIVEMDTSVEEVSKKIGIDKATFYRKMAQGGGSFTVREVDTIAKELHMTKDEVNSIFFSQFVA